MTSLVFLIVATLLGGMATFVALLPYGLLIACIATPFGASTSCALAGAGLYALRSVQGEPAAAEYSDAAVQPQ